MGVSFKIARVGSRYRPRTPPPDPADAADGDVESALLLVDGAADPPHSDGPKAIECGWLPGDMLDDIPCKYYNGTLFCE
ncbi:hypothetical protein B296_00048868, partial [Ensete ventricosum]